MLRIQMDARGSRHGEAMTEWVTVMRNRLGEPFNVPMKQQFRHSDV